MPGIRRGLLSSARRLLGRVGARVARDGLFEQPGERPRTAPLPPLPNPSSPAPSKEPAASSREPAAPRPGAAELADLAAVKRALGPTGKVRVVNHWATWCAPCVEELPQLRALAQALGPDAELLGLSWDLFDPRDAPEAVVAQVADFAQERDMDWPSLVVTAPAEDLFSALDIRWQKIPQTWVLDGQGRILERLEGLLDAEGQRRLLQRVQEAGL